MSTSETNKSRFIPSTASLSPKEGALKQIKQARMAAELVEKYLKSLPDDSDVPAWVVMRMTESAQAMALAVGYIKNQQQKAEIKSASGKMS